MSPPSGLEGCQGALQERRRPVPGAPARWHPQRFYCGYPRYSGIFREPLLPSRNAPGSRWWRRLGISPRPGPRRSIRRSPRSHAHGRGQSKLAPSGRHRPPARVGAGASGESPASDPRQTHSARSPKVVGCFPRRIQAATAAVAPRHRLLVASGRSGAKHRSLLAGLGELAEAGERQPLRDALQGWSALERGARRCRLANVVERIDYDGCRGEVSVCWRAPRMDGAPVSIPLRSRAAVRSFAAAPEESAATTVARLPRITRLLALAVRFEGLLQEGTVRDYADLARLGGVSRARITQIMSLRGRVSRTWGRRSIVRGWCGC